MLLLMMSLVMEDVGMGGAMRLSWRVFKRGWWGFLVVFIVTGIGGILVAMLAAPLVVLVVAGLLLQNRLFLLVLIPIEALFLLVFVIAGLFVAVYTLVMYTLVYRESSRVAD